MTFNVAAIGQIALGVGDVDLAEEFYGSKLGLRKLFRFGDLTFFTDPDGHVLALMCEAPKGYQPAG